MIFLSLLLIPSSSVAALEELSMEGRYVTGERRYEDKGYVYEHYLFVQGEDGIKQYKLDSQRIPDNFLQISGSDVTITGTLTLKDSANLRIQDNEDIKVSEFTVANQEVSQRSLQRPQPASMNSVTLLSGLNSPGPGFHNLAYFDDRHYNLGTDSLAAYWANHSYGKFTWGGTAYDWTNVDTCNPTCMDPRVFGEDQAAAQDAIDAFDSSIDFTNVDQVIFIWDVCAGFAFAYTNTLSFSTDEGTKNLLVVHTFDCDNGFPTGDTFERGIGVTAHEIGHTFGLGHTQQIPDAEGSPYNDEHSLLSGGGADGPPGFLAYHKMNVGWIDPPDVVTVLDGTQQEITLDMANMDSGGPNFLMAMVPFGVNGHNYTVEARTNGTFDAIIGDGSGIWIYHHSPTGHPGAIESVADPEEDTGPVLLLVLANGSTGAPPTFPYFDFDFASLNSGQSFTENDVTFEYLSDTPTSITIRITNNACAPPGPGDWTPGASCEMVGNATVTGNLFLQNGRVLTIPNGVVLTVEGFVFVEVLSGIYIVSGGGLFISPP